MPKRFERGESTQGHFESTQSTGKHSKHKRGKHAVNAALRRLCEEGIIERFGTREGHIAG